MFHVKHSGCRRARTDEESSHWAHPAELSSDEGSAGSAGCDGPGPKTSREASRVSPPGARAGRPLRFGVHLVGRGVPSWRGTRNLRGPPPPVHGAARSSGAHAQFGPLALRVGQPSAIPRPRLPEGLGAALSFPETRPSARARTAGATEHSPSRPSAAPNSAMFHVKHQSGPSSQPNHPTRSPTNPTPDARPRGARGCVTGRRLVSSMGPRSR